MVKGKFKVEGTMEMAGGAKDTTLVTNLNADQVDGADKDTDGALAANSDVKIPSQKAVKTYADARKAECVALTGDQTIAGIKTLSSIPILPASDPTTDNQAVRKAYVDGAATVVHTSGDETISGTKTFNTVPTIPDNSLHGAKINNTLGSHGSQAIGASASWLVPAGIYIFASNTHIGVQVQSNTPGEWLGVTGILGGAVISDGTNVRLLADATGATVNYRKLT